MSSLTRITDKYSNWFAQACSLNFISADQIEAIWPGFAQSEYTIISQECQQYPQTQDQVIDLTLENDEEEPQQQQQQQNEVIQIDLTSDEEVPALSSCTTRTQSASKSTSPLIQKLSSPIALGNKINPFIIDDDDDVAAAAAAAPPLTKKQKATNAAKARKFRHFNQLKLATTTRNVLPKNRATLEEAMQAAVDDRCRDPTMYCELLGEQMAPRKPKPKPASALAPKVKEQGKNKRKRSSSEDVAGAESAPRQKRARKVSGPAKVEVEAEKVADPLADLAEIEALLGGDEAEEEVADPSKDSAEVEASLEREVEVEVVADPLADLAEFEAELGGEEEEVANPPEDSAELEAMLVRR